MKENHATMALKLENQAEAMPSSSKSIPKWALVLVVGGLFLFPLLLLLQLFPDTATASVGVESLQDQSGKVRKLVFVALFLGATKVFALFTYLKERRNKQELEKQNLLIAKQNQIIRKQLEQLEIQNKQLHQFNEEKTKMIHVVSHDLKAPLDRIEGLIKLEDHFPDQKPVFREQLNKVLSSGRRLIKDLLDSNAIEAGQLGLKKEVINVSLLAQNLCIGFQPQAEKKNIELLCYCGMHDNVQYKVNADVIAIERILDNLISNALKFSPKGKKVWVLVEKENKHLLIKVKDQGPGLNSDDLKKLFKPFQRLSAAPTAGETSTGLGLNISKKLAIAHGGDLYYQSPPEGGAEFVLSLPIDSEVQLERKNSDEIDLQERS